MAWHLWCERIRTQRTADRSRTALERFRKRGIGRYFAFGDLEKQRVDTRLEVRDLAGW